MIIYKCKNNHKVSKNAFSDQYKVSQYKILISKYKIFTQKPGNPRQN